MFDDANILQAISDLSSSLINELETFKPLMSLNNE
jgi:hypothetical protein